jgi:hypothetical protein
MKNKSADLRPLWLLGAVGIGFVIGYVLARSYNQA